MKNITSYDLLVTALVVSAIAPTDEESDQAMLLVDKLSMEVTLDELESAMATARAIALSNS